MIERGLMIRDGDIGSLYFKNFGGILGFWVREIRNIIEF